MSGLVNTQFQYIDVGVNVDITPHIHPDGDITLKIALDVSSVINNQPIGGINEPVIGQRKVEHEIRLKDGEVSLLGGMLQQQDAQSQTGIPGLSQIPILKYLFSQKNTEVIDSEIVFVVIPNIVRRKDLNEFNGRTLDVSMLELRIPFICVTRPGQFRISNRTMDLRPYRQQSPPAKQANKRRFGV